MTLDQLRTFIAVAQLGSFSRAGEELHLSQPAISAQVEALEKAYKMKLFDRTSKGVILTEAGKIVLASAEETLRLDEETRQTLDDLQGLRRGSINLEATPVAGIYLMPKIMGQFKEKYPQVDLTMRIDHAWVVLERVLDKSIDLGVMGGGMPIDQDNLIVRPFLKDELVVITPPDHKWAKSAPISPDDLSQYPFIAFGKRAATRRMIEQQMKARGVKLHISLVLGNTEAIKKAVAAGLGISMVSSFAITKEVKAGWLKCFRVAGLSLQRDYSLIWRRGRRVSRALEAFIDFYLANIALDKELRQISAHPASSK